MTRDMVVIDGFRCYAPALALGSDDYPIDLYDRLCRWRRGIFGSKPEIALFWECSEDTLETSSDRGCLS